MEKINPWSRTIHFYKKILTGAIFLLASAANHAWYKPIFYWLHEMAACCYFGAHLGKGLDCYSLSGLTDGTPHSFSDLLHLILLLLSLGQTISSPTPFLPFDFLDKNILSSISFPSSLWTKIF